MNRDLLSRIAAFATAIAVTMVAFGLELVLRPAIFTVPFMLFFLAVAVAAWRGGRWPGFLSIAISAAVANHWFIAPGGPPGFTKEALLSSTLFICVGTLINLLTSSLRDRFVERARLLQQERELRRQSVRTEQALRASERTYRFLAESMPTIVWTAGPDGAIDYVNDVLARYLGKSVEAALGVGWQEIVHPEDLALSIERWTRSVATGEPYEVEHRIQRADGMYRWFLVRAVAMRDASGAIIKWFGSSVDIEDQKKALLALQEAVALREEFLMLASHELKTPLTSLLLHVGGLQRALGRNQGPPTAEQLAKRTDAMARQVERLTDLVGALLDVTKASTGTIDLAIERVDLAAIVEEVCGRFAEDLSRARCPLVLNLHGPVHGLWDRRRLEQVIASLLTNAVKYGAGMAVEVTVRQETAGAILSVRDHGIGVDEADQGRIFERFVRAVPSAHFGGFGLGLWVVRSYIEAMGGTVEVESRRGEGATFIIRLPPSLAPRAESLPSSTSDFS